VGPTELRVHHPRRAATLVQLQRSHPWGDAQTCVTSSAATPPGALARRPRHRRLRSSESSQRDVRTCSGGPGAVCATPRAGRDRAGGDDSAPSQGQRPLDPVTTGTWLRLFDSIRAADFPTTCDMRDRAYPAPMPECPVPAPAPDPPITPTGDPQDPRRPTRRTTPTPGPTDHPRPCPLLDLQALRPATPEVRAHCDASMATSSAGR